MTCPMPALLSPIHLTVACKTELVESNFFDQMNSTKDQAKMTDESMESGNVKIEATAGINESSIKYDNLTVIDKVFPAVKVRDFAKVFPEVKARDFANHPLWTDFTSFSGVVKRAKVDSEAVVLSKLLHASIPKVQRPRLHLEIGVFYDISHQPMTIPAHVVPPQDHFAQAKAHAALAAWMEEKRLMRQCREARPCTPPPVVNPVVESPPGHRYDPQELLARAMADNALLEAWKAEEEWKRRRGDRPCTPPPAHMWVSRVEHPPTYEEATRNYLGGSRLGGGYAAVLKKETLDACEEGPTRNDLGELKREILDACEEEVEVSDETLADLKAEYDYEERAGSKDSNCVDEAVLPRYSP